MFCQLLITFFEHLNNKSVLCHNSILPLICVLIVCQASMIIRPILSWRCLLIQDSSFRKTMNLLVYLFTLSSSKDQMNLKFPVFIKYWQFNLSIECIHRSRLWIIPFCYDLPKINPWKMQCIQSLKTIHANNCNIQFRHLFFWSQHWLWRFQAVFRKVMFDSQALILS